MLRPRLAQRHGSTSARLGAIALGLVACTAEPSTGGVADAGGPVTDGGADAAVDAGATADASPRPGDHWDLLPPLADGVWVRVRNQCEVSLWIHAQGSSATLTPDDVELAPGATRDYEAPRTWSAARVTAYGDGPRAGELDKAEMTFSPADGAASLNYNITYVDWVGLPMRISGAGGSCGAEHLVGCDVPRAELLTDCPTALRDGDRCQSARSYCLNPAHQATAYCHALDDKIAECATSVAGCAPYAATTTPEVYACSGLFSEEPRLCAALNRGMLRAPDSPDDSQYYVEAPYNTYASWVHDVCPGIYAFSYDDWLAQGGFRSCRGSELRITFCPAG